SNHTSTLLRLRRNDYDLIAHRRVVRAEIAACEDDMLIRSGVIVYRIADQCPHAEWLRLGTYDRHALAPDAIVTDPGRLRRVGDVESPWLAQKIKSDAIEDSAAANDPQRLVRVRAPGALDRPRDQPVIALEVRHARSVNADGDQRRNSDHDQRKNDGERQQLQSGGARYDHERRRKQHDWNQGHRRDRPERFDFNL